MTKKRLTALSILWWGISILVLLCVLVYLATLVSPWPYTLLIRKAFADGGRAMALALEKHVPPGIHQQLNEQYDPRDNDAFLDIYYPDAFNRSDTLLPTVVWVHGGGWVAGSKDEIANYCKILSSKGYTVAAVNYALAPAKHFPVQAKQINEAIGYIRKNASRFHVDTSKIFIAGDSGGAQLAAVVSNAISVPAYASLLGITPSIQPSSLKGVLLYCGPYDLTQFNQTGQFAGFSKTVLWAYSGRKNFTSDVFFKTASVINYINKDFPPALITAGNGDPLALQSKWLAAKLSDLGIATDSLFFPENYQPRLPHEFQFNLDSDAGRLALEASLKFLSDKN